MSQSPSNSSCKITDEIFYFALYTSTSIGRLRKNILGIDNSYLGLMSFHRYLAANTGPQPDYKPSVEQPDLKIFKIGL